MDYFDTQYQKVEYRGYRLVVDQTTFHVEADGGLWGHDEGERLRLIGLKDKEEFDPPHGTGPKTDGLQCIIQEVREDGSLIRSRKGTTQADIIIDCVESGEMRLEQTPNLGRA